MKALAKGLMRLLRTVWIWSLLLVSALSLLLWCAGPSVAFNDVRPWEEATARLFSVCMLLLAWGLFLVFNQWRQPPQNTGAKKAEERALKARRLSILRQMGKAFAVAQQRLLRGSLYRSHNAYWRKNLPWFLLLGTPGSGKTSLIEYSALELPLNPREDRKRTPPAPSKGIDWYFAEHGVLLDTPGDYLGQTHAEAPLRWQALLQLLRKRRPTKPLSGVIVNVAVDTLQTEDPLALQTLALQVQARLLDLHRQLRCSVPVYLVLSKADALPGFNEFYQHPDRMENPLVLGVGVQDGEVTLDCEQLTSRLMTLERHLHSQLINRTQRERDLARLAPLMGFPAQLLALGKPLRAFVDIAFAGNRYQPASRLQGVYLTRAPAAAVERKVDSNDPQSQSNTADKAKRPIKPLIGSPRFIEQLFSRVIFGGSALAQLDIQEVRRIRRVQVSKCVAAALCLGVGTSALYYSYLQNSAQLNDLDKVGQRLHTARHAPLDGDEVIALLPRLRHSKAATLVFNPAMSATLLQRNGLYQGDEVSPALYQAYEYELDTQLLPGIARQLARQVQADFNNRTALLQSLGTYLMLGDTVHRDDSLLRTRLIDSWQQRYAQQPQEREELQNHLQQLLSRPFRYPLDEKLIRQARGILRSVSNAEVAYQALKERTSTLPAYRFNRHLDPHGLLFSGTDLAIPGLYTRKGYQQYFLAQSLALVRESLRENWVMGDSAVLELKQMHRVRVDLEKLYLHDYANYWSEALAAVALLPMDSASRGAEQANALAAADSPLVKLLSEIRENTRLIRPSAAAIETLQKPGEIANAKEIVGTVLEKAKDVALAPLPDRAKQILERRFVTLHQLLEEDGTPAAELISSLQALNNVYLQLATLTRSSQPEQAAFELAKTRMNGQPDGISHLRLTAARLPQPLNQWLTPIADDSWRLILDHAYNHANSRYHDELLSPYRNTIEQRYPFNANSESEVTLPDFTAFFKAEGLADRFFDRYLKPFTVGTPGNYRLRHIEGLGLPISKHLLSQMSRIHAIQEGFFAESANQPKVSFRLQPYTLDQNVGRAEFRFGDKVLEYRHGPIVPMAFSWPASADNESASLVVEKLSGDQRPVGFEESTGPWSLFRLVERMETEYHRGRDVLLLKAEIRGTRVNYLLTSQRTPNPFLMTELRGFSLPVTL